MTWFWLVIFYSFGGYLLEKGYAAVVYGAILAARALWRPDLHGGRVRGAFSL